MKLVILLLLVSLAQCADILSTFPHMYSINGTIFSKTRFTIRCNGEGSTSFSIQRENSDITDQVTITCSAPEVIYNCQHYSYVPLGQFLARIPIALTGDIVINHTAQQDAYADRLFQDSLRNTDIPPKPTLNILSRRPLQAPDQDDINKLINDQNTDSGSTSSLDVISESQLTSWEKIHKQNIVLDIFNDLFIGFAKGGKAGIGLALVSFALTGGLDLGRKDPLDEVMENLKIIFNDIALIVKAISTLFHDQFKINAINNERFRDTAAILTSIENRQSADELYLSQLKNRSELILNLTNATIVSVDKRFGDVQQRLDVLFGVENQTAQVIQQIVNREDERFAQTINTFHLVNQQLIALVDAVEAVKQNKEATRIAALAFHKTLDSLGSEFALGPTKPFMNDIGAAPLSDQQRLDIRKVENAIVVASVEIQGTRLEPGNAYATQIQIELLCDPTYIANFTMSAISFDFIIQSVGPHTSDQDSCVDPWYCNCVFKVNYTQIHLPNTAKLYPFGASLGGLPMYLDPYINEIAPDDCLPGQIYATGCANSLALRYFDTMDGLSKYLSGTFVCSKATPGIPNWVNSVVRVSNARIGYFVDITMNPNSYTGGVDEMCNGDYNLAASNRTTLAFTVFTYLTKEFNMYFPTIRSIIEKRLYGSLGQVAISDYIGSRLPGLVNAYRSLIVEFVSLTARLNSPAIRQLPVYLLTRAGIRFKVQIQVNDQDPVDVTLGSKELSMPINDSHTGNMTITSNNELYSITQESLLKDDMLWLGAEVDYVSDTRTHDTNQQPKVLYDFGDTELCFGGAHQRTGCLNYLQLRKDDTFGIDNTFPYGEGMPFNLSMWQTIEQATFEPNKIVSPSSIMVEIDRDQGVCTGRRLDPRTMQYEPQGPPRFMCSVRKNFKLPIQMSDGTDVVFKANEWTYDFILDWSGTKIQEISITRCPDSVNIVAEGTRVEFISSTPITMKVSVCSTLPGDCLVNGDVVPGTYTLQFGAINRVYYLQVWPATDPSPTISNRCYGQSDGLGIPLSVTKNYTFVTGLPGNVETAVTQLLVPSQLQLFDQQITIGRIVQSLALLASEVGSTAIINQLNTIISDAKKNLGNTSLSDDPALDEALREALEVYNQTEQIIDEAIARAAAEAGLEARLTGNLNFLNNVSDILLAKFKNDSTLLDNLIDKFINDLNTANKDDGDGLFDGLFDAFRDIVKELNPLNLFGMLGNLFGIGDWFGIIMQGFMICLLCCCVGGIAYICIKGSTMIKNLMPASAPAPTYQYVEKKT